MGPRQAERTLAIAERPPAPDSPPTSRGPTSRPSPGGATSNGYDPLVPESRRSALDGMGAGRHRDTRAARERPRPAGAARRALAAGPDGGAGHRPGRRRLRRRARRGDRAAAAASLRACRSRARPRCASSASSRARPPSSRAGSSPSASRASRTAARSGCRSARGSTPPSGRGTAPTCARPCATARPRCTRSFAAREGFAGHQYRGVAAAARRASPSRALRFRAWPGAPPLWLLRAGLHDAVTGRSIGVSLASATRATRCASPQAADDAARAACSRSRRGIGPAWVVESLRRLPDERARARRAARADAARRRHEARGARDREDAAGLVLPAGSRSSAADVAARDGRSDRRARRRAGAARRRRGLRPGLDGARRRRARARRAGERRPHGARAAAPARTASCSPPRPRASGGLGRRAGGASGLGCWWSAPRPRRVV